MLSTRFRLFFISLCLAGMLFFFLSGARSEAYDGFRPEREISEPVMFDGHEVMNALLDAYPGICMESSVRKERIAIKVNGRWFLWHEGALVPEDSEEGEAIISGDMLPPDPIPFYRYAEKLSQPPVWTLAEKAEIVDRVNSFYSDPPERNSAFFDEVWGGRTEPRSWEMQARIKFMGFPVTVHKSLVDEYSAIEKELSVAARKDPAVRKFLSNIWRVSGWNWRDIAGTGNRSFHSYGAAVDFEPRKLNGKVHYWRWLMETDRYWFCVPLSRRLHPPDAIVKAFERHGFVWGGKWFFFDSLHFEYRPEILILNGLAAGK